MSAGASIHTGGGFVINNGGSIVSSFGATLDYTIPYNGSQLALPSKASKTLALDPKFARPIGFASAYVENADTPMTVPEKGIYHLSLEMHFSSLGHAGNRLYFIATTPGVGGITTYGTSTVSRFAGGSGVAHARMDSVVSLGKNEVIACSIATLEDIHYITAYFKADRIK